MKRLQLQSWQPQVTKKLLLSFQLNAFINSWQIWWFLLKDYLFNYFYLLMQKNLLINFSTLFFYTAFPPLFCDCVTFIRVFGSIWGEIGYLAFVKMCLFFSYFFCCQLQLNQMNEEIFHISLILIMVFCYQNCSYLLWEKLF